MAETIALVALFISAITAWLTLFRRGTIRMTQPTIIFFGPDTPLSADDPALPKVFLRTLLFATSKRGRVIQSMHVALARNETRQNFNIWVHGDHKLMRGSGLFVGETGIATNHHFLAPRDAAGFKFIAGRYRLEVFARILGKKAPTCLFAQELDVSPEIGAALEQHTAGVFFDWGPDASRYTCHVEKRAPLPSLLQFLAQHSD
jgi:hypothetical protein